MRSTTEQFDHALAALPAALVSLICHLLLLIVLALVVFNRDDKEPLVLNLSQTGQDATYELETHAFEFNPIEPLEEVEQIARVDQIHEVVLEEIVSPVEREVSLETGSSDQLVSKDMNALSDPDLAPIEGVSVKFSDAVQYAQQHGMDIVIVFDSTGSMGSEIDAVKQRITAISTMILKKIPKARFSLVTYRDLYEQYAARGTQLTDSVPEIYEFIEGVTAQGGGDEPEAVQAGMEWAMTRLSFGDKTKKAMLIFGDAPPHRHDVRFCVKMAHIFKNQGGRVSTITCRSYQPLPEFYEIAQAGGGEAYTMFNANGLMEELLVMAFGREHREDVLKFFELDSRMPRFD
jgi:Mg-chelatase subunit ChlD